MWPMVARYDYITTKTNIEPVTADRCAKCDREQPDLAHHVFELVGAVLAEPLRRAFDAHLDEHGCGDPKRGSGFGHCDEAMRVFRLLPDGDQVLIA